VQHCKLTAGFASALAVLRTSIKEACFGIEIDECQLFLNKRKEVFESED